jgi:acetyl-CoA acetyltransferase
VGENERSKRSGKSTLAMAVEAGRAAIDDAGIDPAEIDCVLSYELGLDSTDGHSVAMQLGFRPDFQMDTIGGGSATETLVTTACALIDSGVSKNVLIFRSLLGRSGIRKGDLHDLGGVLEFFHPGSNFIGPYGLTTGAHQFGMVAARHMWETGTTEEQLGHLCVTFYEHAQRNPNAFFYGKPLDMETYLDTPYISKPFRLHDCCVESDEANAIIVSSAERARDCKSNPVYIMGAAGRVCGPSSVMYGMEDITKIGAYYAAPVVFGMAGITPEDLDVAALYDCFSWVPLAQLEAFGIVPRGEAGAFAEEGNLRIDGKLPCNTAGGMLSEGYTHGMNNTIELVRQLRHDYQGEERQVKDAEIGLSCGWDGPHASSALILRGEQHG